MKLYAPAKLNLFLEVLNRRPDGYHTIESIFQSVSLFDTITILPNDVSVTLACAGADLPSDERNIALRAALLLKKEFGVAAGAKIVLDKKIPMGAGLGGGSSDAAAVIKGLVKLWKIRSSKKRLVSLAARLGADVPFFLTGGTAQVGGIGERVRALHGVKRSWYVLVYPRVLVPTASVYKLLRVPLPLTKTQKITKIRNLLISGSASTTWKPYIFNRLEEAVFRSYPQVRRVRDVLTRLGYPCLMSGSGSTVFTVVSSLEEGRRIKAKIKDYPWDIVVVRTV